MTDTPNRATTVPSVVLRDINTIVAYERNAKKHNREQVRQLADSIFHYGWTQPIVIDSNNVIIAGHGRYEAALLLRLERVPVIVRDDLDETQIKALRLADNKLVCNDYDQEMLRLEIVDVRDKLTIDLRSLGFSESELACFLTDAAPIDLDGLVDQPVAVKKVTRQKKQKTTEPLLRRQDFLGALPTTVENSNLLRSFQSAVTDKTGEPWPQAFLTFIKTYMNDKSTN